MSDSFLVHLVEIYPTSVGQLAFLCLMMFGLTFLIKDSTILSAVRELFSKVPFFERLLSCSFCVGTWVGLLIGACRLLAATNSDSVVVIGDLSGYYCVEVLVAYAMVSAVASYTLDLVTQALETYIHGG